MGGAPEAAPSALFGRLGPRFFPLSRVLGWEYLRSPSLRALGSVGSLGLSLPLCGLRPRPLLAAIFAVLRWLRLGGTAAAQPLARMRVHAQRAPNAHQARA